MSFCDIEITIPDRDETFDRIKTIRQFGSAMIKPALAVLVALVIASLFQSPRQGSRVELDHVFIVVSPGASAEIEALQSAGLTVGSRVTQHPGLGTASRSVLFENAYLELIWVDSSVPVDSKHVSQ